MGTSRSESNNSADYDGRRNLTGRDRGSATTDGAGCARSARRLPILFAVLSLIALGAVLLGLPEFSNRAGGKNLNGNAQSAYQQISARNVSNSTLHTPSASTFVSSASVFDSKFNIDLNQGYLLDALETSHDGAQLLRVQGPGRCSNPHPGPFRSWNGMQNGCLIQTWRQWQDGCTHFQWFNTCYNVWDPQIYWTYCVH